MKMLNSTSPETLREDILKYLDWRIQGHRRAACSASLQRTRLVQKTAADALNEAYKDIADSMLVPLVGK